MKDLVLRDEVVQAVKERKFHIYPVERIEEGIQILTGKPAGKQNAKSQYEKNSVFQLVAKRLKEMAGEEKEKGNRRKGKGK